MRLLHFTLVLVVAACLGNASATTTKMSFEQILELSREIYETEFQRQSHRLRIRGQWESERVEASAHREEDRDGQLAVITITGGLARHPGITVGALALVLCHEIGHFLAGEPAVRGYSTEGQADYYAAAVCMPRLLSRLPEASRPKDQEVPDLVVGRCTAAFRRAARQAACIQTTMSGLTLSHFFAERKRTARPWFETPDPGSVSVVGFATPTVQCRLDTFSAAALCNPEVENAVGRERPWICTREGALPHAARPFCWFPGLPQ